ncbi:hypothetical protein [Luteitalea sp.]
MRVSLPVAAFVLASVVLGTGTADSQAPATGVQQTLVGQLRLSAEQIATVRSGVPVAVVLPSGLDREVAVGAAVRVNTPASRMVDVIRDIERLERGRGFLATHKFSTPPTLEDMAALRLPAEDVRAIRSCRPGDCDVKLGRAAFDALSMIDWKAPDVSGQVHQLARGMVLEYLGRYRANGNDALPIYLDSERPLHVAKEFEDLARKTAGLTAELPEVSRYLLEYPKGRPSDVEDYFYWSLGEFGLKPVLRLNHAVIHPTGRSAGLQYVITTKQLYASHYFHTAIEVRVLYDDRERPGQGHYLVVVNRARLDGLTGLFGPIVRSKARNGARNGLQAVLGGMKKLAETGRAD